MVDVDKMSDAELRAKLIEFGFPVMPITGTTRKTMMKKLKMLMENQNNIGKNSTGRRSLGRYSSEDDSDSDTKAAAASVKKDKYKRQTMGAPMMQPPSLKRRTIKVDSPLEAPPPPVKREVKTSTTTTRTMKIMEAAKDDFDTGSESDEVAEKYNNTSSRESSNLSDRFKSMSQSSPNRLPTSFLSAASAVDAASDRINQIRSRLSQYNSSYDRTPYSTDTGDLLKDREDTPFLSNFTKRLSQLSDTPNTSYDYKNDVIKENDVNGASAPNTRTYLNNFRATRGRPTNFDYRSSNSSIFKNNFVPFMVLIVAFLFFIIVAVVYLGIRSDGTSLDVTAKVPVCVKSDSSSRRYVNCVLEGEGKPAFHLLEVLKPELQKRALKNTCDDHKVKPYMTEAEIISYITHHFAIKNETRIMNDLSNLEVLTFYNPSWGISIAQFDEDGVEFKSNAIVKDMESVLEGKRSKVTALIANSLNVPWSCYFYNTILFFIKILGSLTGGVLVLYLLNNAFKYYKQLRHKQQDEEISMVENIIDILQTNVSDTNDNYMVINHVRDMILAVNERKAKQKIWERAVKYIAEHESRIRTEVQTVRGEPSEVWRWLGGSNLNTSKSKTWQGQAFETEVGSVNSLPCSPTPCLKIRGMIEEGDTNTLAIKKAVASKCAQQCRILHCGVDTKLNCVYLKCADTSDAAIAYRNLHGWWYAGNLVTVKYLRLERYMQRFPDSPVKGPPYLQ